MNFLTCRKCGTKLMGVDARLNDIYEYRLELQSELKKIGNNEKLKKRVKELHIEIDNINRQLGREKNIAHLESRLNDRSAPLVEALKEYVSRDQFLNAVKIADRKNAEYEQRLKEERNRLYGFAKDISERRSNRNSGGYVDRTASEAIRNVDRRR